MGANDTSQITEQVDSRLDDLFGPEDDTEESSSTPPPAADSADESPGGEVEQRLDRFFGDESSPDPPPRKPARETTKMESSPISELKSVILSLEWEITDQVMGKLGEEIRKLEETYRSDKIIVAFLQLLGSLGKYIRKKRAEAHPESIRLLNSVYENLEMILGSDQIGEAEKKKMLVTQVNQYKELQKEIKSPSGARRLSPEETPEPREEIETELPSESPVSAPEEDGGAMMDLSGPAAADTDAAHRHQEMISAIRSLQKTIQEEVRALRQDIQRLSDR